jgi:hypothetical protein
MLEYDWCDEGDVSAWRYLRRGPYGVRSQCDAVKDRPLAWRLFEVGFALALRIGCGGQGLGSRSSISFTDA